MVRRVRCWLLLVVTLGWMLPVAGLPAETAKKTRENDYDLYKTLAEVVEQVERNYVTEVSRRELIESAIRGMLNRLDPYSTYMSADEMRQFRTSLAGEFGGIGIQIDIDDGQLTIVSPIYGTPAYRAGLLAGDRILEINGRGTDGIGIDEAVNRLKGDVGTSVTLTVAHQGQKSAKKVTIVREKIHLDTVLGDRRAPDGTWQFMLDPQKRIGYVRLTAFSPETAAALRRVLTGLQKEKLRGLILDLRWNPGGLLNAAVEVSDLFVAEGRIVSVQGRNSPERIWDAHKEGTFTGFPMAVLVNRYSASASEIVAACLQDHRRAAVIGERTWGKGSVQNVVELEDGRGMLKLTTASYRRPNGKNIHRFPDAKATDQWGVTPDKGFEFDLSDGELLSLMLDRRRRDIVQPPPAKDAATKGKSKSDSKWPAAVDRQLQAAVKYIEAELAKSPEKR
jgi:carboxyl-terminal processing protease